MRLKIRTLFAFLASLAVVAAATPPPAAFASTIDLSWDACSPVVTSTTVGAGDVRTLFVSVTGHSDTHHCYEVFIHLADASNEIPDAWRFDAAGCAGPSRVNIDWMGSGSKTCPSFIGDNPLVITAYNHGPASWPTAEKFGTVIVASCYDKVEDVDPAKRYLLARVSFDHARSVIGPSNGEACGGVETPLSVAFVPERCNWLHGGYTDPLMEERFDIGNGALSVNGGPSAVPAPAVTWGQIKSTYRR